MSAPPARQERRPSWEGGGWLALAALLLLLPLARPSVYVLHVAFIVLIYVTLAVSWNIIGGFAGYVDFGKVVYFGMGAYFTAILYRDLDWSPFLMSPAAGLFGAAIAAGVGWITLRLRGDYFAIATLAFAFIVELAASHVPITGGGMGIVLPPPPMDIWASKVLFFEVMLVIALATCLVSYWISTSGFGYGLRAIRESEDVAEVVGVPTTRLKVFAYVLSSFFPALAGGVYSFYVSYIEAHGAFSPLFTINAILMVILGGIGTFSGPIIGAILLATLSEVLSVLIVNEIKLVVFGALLILVVLFLPRGILGRVAGGRLAGGSATSSPRPLFSGARER